MFYSRIAIICILILGNFISTPALFGLPRYSLSGRFSDYYFKPNRQITVELETLSGLGKSQKMGIWLKHRNGKDYFKVAIVGNLKKKKSVRVRHPNKLDLLQSYNGLALSLENLVSAKSPSKVFKVTEPFSPEALLAKGLLCDGCGASKPLVRTYVRIAREIELKSHDALDHKSSSAKSLRDALVMVKPVKLQKTSGWTGFLGKTDKDILSDAVADVLESLGMRFSGKEKRRFMDLAKRFHKEFGIPAEVLLA